MAQLAIKGHAKRGKEVIEILEMLGGKQGYEICTGSDTGYHWYIKDNGLITCNYSAYKNDCVEYTLEEFIEKYPYKVGDKVSSKYLKNYKIEKMEWEDTNNRVIYKLQGMGWYSAEELQLYKEETMKDNIIDTVKESDDRYRIVLNHQFDMEVDEGEYYAVRRKPQYPKTYVECCKIKQSDPNFYIDTHLYSVKLESLYKLLICRDAYWRLADDWKPDWEDEKPKYGLIVVRNRVEKQKSDYVQIKFCFPTEEMCDAFYENFEELIEECKELL